MEPAVNHRSRKSRGNAPQFIRTAKTLLLRRRTKEAINLLRRGLNLEPHCDEAALLLAKALTAVKRLVEARTILEKLLGRTHHLDASVLLARVCLALDDAPMAMDVVQQALQIAPTDQRLIELEAKVESHLDDTQEEDAEEEEQEEERSTEQQISSRRAPEAEEIPTEDTPTPRPSDGLNFEQPPGVPTMTTALQQLVDQDQDDAPTAQQLSQCSNKTVPSIKPLEEIDLDDMPTPPEEYSAPDIISALRKLVDDEPDTEETPTPRRPLFDHLLKDKPLGQTHPAPLDPTPLLDLQALAADPEEVGGVTPPSTPSAIIRRNMFRSGSHKHLHLIHTPTLAPHVDLPSAQPNASFDQRRSSQVVELIDASGRLRQHRMDDSRVVLPVDGKFIDLPPDRPLGSEKEYLAPKGWAAPPARTQLQLTKKKPRARTFRLWHLILTLALAGTTAGVIAGLVVRQRGQATRSITNARELAHQHSAQDLRAALVELREAANLIGRKPSIVALAAYIHARLALEFGESNLKGVEGLIDESLRLGAMTHSQSLEDIQVSRAYLHLAQKPLPSAIGYLVKSVEKHPENLQLHLLYGNALAANGETFLAGRILDKLPANNAAVLQARAWLSWRKGAKAEARALLQAAGKVGLPAPQVDLGLVKFKVEEGTEDESSLQQLRDLLQSAKISSKQSAWAHLLRGIILQKQGQLLMAQEALEKALTRRPLADQDFDYFAGSLQLALHHIDHARKEAQSALDRAPHDLRFATLMASIELAMDRPAAALKLLTAVDDPNTNTRMLMAEAYLQQGQPLKAHQMLHLAGAATAPPRRLLLARILLAQDQPYQALGELKGLDRQAEFSPQLQLVRGLIALKLNNQQEATQLLKSALHADRYSITALMKLGELALNTNQGQKAMEYLERAVSVAPYHRQARIALGQHLLRLEQFREAEDEFDRALTLDSNEVSALIGRARAAVELDSKDASLYIRSVQTCGHRLSASLLSARLLMIQGKLDKASAALTQLLSRPLPDRALAELWLAQVLHRQGQLDLAIEAYHTALSNKENVARAALGLSKIYSQRGDSWAALKFAKQANQQLRFGIFPMKVKARVKMQLTRCYRKTHDLGAAIAELQDILEFDKTHTGANLELGRIYLGLHKRDRAVTYLIAALATDRGKGEVQRELNRICHPRATAPANCP